MRIAFLVAGQMRHKCICFQDLITKHNMDVFVSSDVQYGVRHTQCHDKLLPERFLSYGNEVDIAALNIPNVIRVNLEKMDVYTKYNYIHPSIIKACGDKDSPIGTVYNIYHISKCLELMKEYEKEQKIEYDIVIKVRPDISFEHDICDVLRDLSDCIIFSKNCSNNRQKSDKVFLGKRYKIIDFIEKIKCYSIECWSKQIKSLKFQHIPIGERLFNQVVVLHNIPFRVMNDHATKIKR